MKTTLILRDLGFDAVCLHGQMSQVRAWRAIGCCGKRRPFGFCYVGLQPHPSFSWCSPSASAPSPSLRPSRTTFLWRRTWPRVVWTFPTSTLSSTLTFRSTPRLDAAGRDERGGEILERGEQPAHRAACPAARTTFTAWGGQPALAAVGAPSPL